MIAVALWAAVFSLVFPAVVSSVFHAKLAAACWVLADKRLVVRTLAAAKLAAAFYVVRQRLKLFAALRIGAFSNDPLSASKATASF